MKPIVIMASCDTKYAEVQFLKQFIQDLGRTATIVDISIGPEKTTGFDFGREQVLETAGYDWEKVKGSSKNDLMTIMTEAVAVFMPRMYAERGFDGILCVGGLQNTILGASAMKRLPIGLPKVIVSTVASGVRTFEPIVGTKDIVVIPSVADLAGMNIITETVLSNAAGCIVGMANGYGRELSNRNRMIVGTTLMGVTNNGVCHAIDELTKRGIETVGFHSTGVGGRAMEELALSGVIGAVMDLTLHEITAEFFGGGFSYGANNRLEALCSNNFPLVVAPGGVDFIDYPLEQFPYDITQRKYLLHNKTVAHIKILKDEAVKVAEIIAGRLNLARQEVTLLIPLKGFRANTLPGEALYDKEVDEAITETLVRNVGRHVEVVYVDANINDYEFGKAAADAMEKMLKKRGLVP
ncbi:MAG: Tm-1-like ATP-binding domain-containing protein [Negativicutes bacterium]|nr:Tm-1-like ATP-binding domain-containing protein [Negativicutes bacterium]